MADDVKIIVRAPGAQKADRDIRKVAAAEKALGQAGEKAGAKAKKGAKGAAKDIRAMGGAADSVAAKVKAMAASFGLLVVGRKALSAIQEDLAEIDRTSIEVTKSMRAILALSNLQRAPKEEQAAVWKFALAAGRDITEAAPAYYSLLGGTSGMAAQRQQGLLGQSALMARTDMRANLDALVQLFSTVGTQQPKMQAQQIGNLISKSIEQAKSTPSEMGMYLPGILTTAGAGGADITTAVAMFNLATRKGGGVATSGTAVRAALLGLLSPTPEITKGLQKFGYQSGADLIEKVQWLTERGGELPPEMTTQLGGRRGLEAIAAISRFPKEFTAEVGAMKGAIDAPGSLLGGRLRKMYGAVPAQRWLDQINQLQILETREKTDTGAMRQQAHRKLRELLMRKYGWSAISRKMEMWAWDVKRAAGMDPVSGVYGETRAMHDLLDEGYSPEDIIEYAYPAMREAGAIPQERTPWGVTPRHQRQWTLEHARPALRAAGATPMQGNVTTYQGGTHYHNQDKRDPAGRPRTPVGAF